MRRYLSHVCHGPSTLHSCARTLHDPKHHTSLSSPGHRKYPYLLRGLQVDRPNQVWASDITYVPLARGFMYLVAIIDWHSRCVLCWRLSNSLESSFCIEALEEALSRGRPEIFNTDQGVQFTSMGFTERLAGAGIRISMDGKGRALDNVFIERLWWSVKYERCLSPRPSDGLLVTSRVGVVPDVLQSRTSASEPGLCDTVGRISGDGHRNRPRCPGMRGHGPTRERGEKLALPVSLIKSVFWSRQWGPPYGLSY